MKNSEYIIYGMRPLIEAVKSGKEIDKVLVQSGLRGDLYQELQKVLKEHHVLWQSVPPEKLNRMVEGNHQGVVAYLSMISYPKFEEVFERIVQAEENPLLLICDRVTDVRNFGAIVRTAECAGVQAVIIPARNSARINQDAVKTSAGALHRVPVCREENLKTVIHFLRASGVQILAATEKSKSLYTEADFTKPTAIILGSEEDGVSSEYIKLCDAQLRIPLKGEIQSLNVSVANGILLYEAVRQRG